MSIPTSTDGSAQSELSPQYLHPTYLLRRKMLKLFGGRIDLYGPNEQPVMCCL